LKCFNKCITIRSSGNAIKAIKVNYGWAQTPTVVMKKVVKYFTNQVTTTWWDRPKLDGVAFERLLVEKNRALVGPFL